MIENKSKSPLAYGTLRGLWRSAFGIHGPPPLSAPSVGVRRTVPTGTVDNFVKNSLRSAPKPALARLFDSSIKTQAEENSMKSKSFYMNAGLGAWSGGLTVGICAAVEYSSLECCGAAKARTWSHR
jgi:hypothetical protein